MKVMESIRWAFNFITWQPTREEWLLAARCIQPEEKERISKFVFGKDAKAAMAGRLLLRKLISEKLNIAYEKIILSRTHEGKPYLVNSPKNNSLNFNISHEGSYAVLAADFNCEIGVDVMNIQRPVAKSVKEFFDLMTRQFTQHEWNNIKKTDSENNQLFQFYRHWCLKESYVKATGRGIGFGLQRLNFHILTDELKPGTLTCNTKLFVDGIHASQWNFEETMIDDTHCVAVAVSKQDSQDIKDNSEEDNPSNSVSLFKILNYSELISGAVPLQEEDEEYWTTFQQKALSRN